ncbi:MAG: MarR family transcriptional regulator [Desulfurococcales archaeon]|nr:MarR family transcriptional regulator [Desulfurococcales archaeon]
MSEHKIIEILEKAGPRGVAQSDIQRILGLSRSWVSEILSSMEKKGIIVRSKGPGKTLVVKLSRYGDPSVSKVLTVGLVPSVEYLPLLLFIKKVREWGYHVEPSIRKSVLEVAVSFIRGEYHLAYLPIYIMPLLKTLGMGFRLIGSVALGGASLVGRQLSNVESIFSSMLSTMEILSIAYMRSMKSSESHLGPGTSIRYYRDPDSVIETLVRGGSYWAMIWEPYSSIAEIKGLKKFPVLEHLGEYHCCVLIARESIASEILLRVKKAHIESIEEISKHIDTLSQGFSDLIGFPQSIVKKGYREYIFTHQINTSALRNIAKSAEGFMINADLLEETVKTIEA